jgi:hypothetical protein
MKVSERNENGGYSWYARIQADATVGIPHESGRCKGQRDDPCCWVREALSDRLDRMIYV